MSTTDSAGTTASSTELSTKSRLPRGSASARPAAMILNEHRTGVNVGDVPCVVGPHAPTPVDTSAKLGPSKLQHFLPARLWDGCRHHRSPALVAPLTMNGYPPPMGVPKSPWRATKTQDGREYYHNSVTNVTTWEKPDELKDDIEVCDLLSRLLSHLLTTTSAPSPEPAGPSRSPMTSDTTTTPRRARRRGLSLKLSRQSSTARSRTSRRSAPRPALPAGLLALLYSTPATSAASATNTVPTDATATATMTATARPALAASDPTSASRPARSSNSPPRRRPRLPS